MERVRAIMRGSDVNRPMHSTIAAAAGPIPCRNFLCGTLFYATDMAAQGMVITIDGPAGAGKSTVARRLAGRLGLDFLDTGAMYRGVAAAAIGGGINPADHAAVGELSRRMRIAFDWKADPPTLLIDGSPVTDRLRDPDVTAAVSEIASNGAVREVLVKAQREIGRAHPRLVTEGRDQGSVVFPDAAVKFYLDASPAVRARRRAEQLRAAGKPADEKQIFSQIVARDERDTKRIDGPLICPPDASRIDTSAMTLDQVVDHLAGLVAASASRRAGVPR